MASVGSHVIHIGLVPERGIGYLVQPVDPHSLPEAEVEDCIEAVQLLVSGCPGFAAVGEGRRD